MNDRVLFVDDDANLLASFRRQFGREFRVETASDGNEAIRTLNDKGPFAVVVSDLRMPGMSGTELLKKTHVMFPDTTRILLTGYADLQSALDAVNHGNVFRLLTKPASPESLRLAINTGREQHQLKMDQRDLLEGTLSGSLKVLSEVLSLISPEAFGRTNRLRKVVNKLADILKIRERWQIDAAAMLALIGFVSIPEGVLHRHVLSLRLTLDEEDMIRRHPQVGHELLVAIPRMKEVADIVLYQNRRYDGWDDTGLTASGPAIPMGSRLLKVALDFDEAMQKGLGPRGAFQQLENHPMYYDPRVLEALREAVAMDDPNKLVTIRVDQVKAGMILHLGLFNNFGVRLVAEGTEVTPALLSRILGMASRGMVTEPFIVQLPPELAAEMDIPAEIPHTDLVGAGR
ncbi:HD domain-containing phosphohydrolase [Zavarzinella formosa]|uniref:HD domain-containing phosphohydrolase n=1 Tax=Zavarzinella formosa TaxID=360055 RepID=UPI000311B3B6|nr:HD domain-containing phosphohydrolase [Zavarzinella formosa]